jgi:hypothetical protein
VQIGHFESSPYLPTLDSLDAEFGYKDEQYAAARRREGGAPMSARFSSTQSEFPTQLEAARPKVDAMTRSSLDANIMRPSLAKRASRSVARFVLVFCIGAAATFAWQLYGDAARATIANSSPQLGWLAPQTAPVVPTAHDVVAPAAAASPELQQLTVGLAFVRQSIDQLAAQFATNQRQMADDIAKLQTNEQEILHKLSATPPRPAAAPARKPDPVTPSPSAQAR